MILWEASPTPMKRANCDAASASERPPTIRFAAQPSLIHINPVESSCQPGTAATLALGGSEKRPQLV